MFNLSDIIGRIQDVLESERGERIFEKDVAKALGMTPGNLSGAKRRNSVPFENIAEFCVKNKINLNWVLCGQSTGMLDTTKEDVFKVRLLNSVHTSAGGGAVNEAAEDITYLTVDPMFVDMLNITDKENIEAIRVVGDSMEDTIGEGSIILIDRGRTDITSGGIFVLNTQSGVIVKRISLNPNGHIDLISDNKIYPVQTVAPDEVTVIGKVVGALEKI